MNKDFREKTLKIKKKILDKGLEHDCFQHWALVIHGINKPDTAIHQVNETVYRVSTADWNLIQSSKIHFSQRLKFLIPNQIKQTQGKWGYVSENQELS